ncbi:Moderate conductance mechanosensitive channel YbiO precursor [Pigmentiphaga humi]|uniref:Moderate conductance mechanosensitive channel YbiO n=1 Tax=Pigmentiphaga humi TaxID=2478468 RepID=A0A3P4B419_9BURK|nr:mechanosensitive ion channel domain-containing protein [Pigmentiphaga humi]VCU70430.1 Moderate conductance mechanosensitive channel YbiO precursor [Pigmentiphaga humi]
MFFHSIRAARPWHRGPSRPWLAALLLAVSLALGLFAGAARAAPAEAAPADHPALTPAALAELLDDPKAREALIEQLRARAPAAQAAARPAPRRAGEDSAPLRTRLADGVERFLAGLATDVEEGVDDMKAIASGQLPRMPAGQAAGVLLGLAAVAAAAIAAFVLMRLVALWIYGRIDRWVASLGRAATATPEGVPVGVKVLCRRAVAIVGAVIIDAVVVLLAAAAGYAVAAYLGPGRGALPVLAAVFLKAFVAVEMTKVLIRTVFATRHPHLRLLPVSDETAGYWNGRIVFITAVAGYGTMLVDPLASTLLSPALGRMVGLLIMLGIYVYAVRVIWRNRRNVRERMEEHARSDTALLRRPGLLARTWHILGIAYFTVLLVVSQVDPANALPFMVKATLQTVLVAGVAALLVLVLNSLLARPIRLSDDTRRRLPMLEARLNSYVPAALKLLGLAIRVMALLVILDGWHAFDLARWITSDAGSRAIGTAVNVAIVLLIATLAWTVVASIIEHRLSLKEGGPMPSAREKTLLSLFRNAALIVIVAMTTMVVLSQIGIDVAPLIAGAGVVGLAVGFGAQKLVQDIITGVFIQLENGMNENDVVQVAGVFGTVEKMTIRSVGIRTLDGGYHLVPFSSVEVVSNHMRDFSYHLGEYTISHRESVDDAMAHLRGAFAELMTDEILAPEILEEISIPGVTAVNEKGVTIRVLIKTRPGMQWAVQRGYNRLVKKHFSEAGIEVPYPQMVVHFGEDRQGQAPAARVALQGGEEGAAERPGVDSRA